MLVPVAIYNYHFGRPRAYYPTNEAEMDDVQGL